ncbi:MAG: ATP-binding protein [Kiloniellaceae bacterium]
MTAVSADSILESPPRFRRLSLSIRGKIILLAAGIALITALVVGAANYTRIAELTRDEATGRLSSQSSLIAHHLQNAFGGLRADVLTISSTPPFQGLARSLPQMRADPLDGSTADQWRKRLETIFGSIIAHRPGYVQLRYIGIADGGREIVRVDRFGDEILTIAIEDLQRRTDESYIRDSLGLAEGEVYFSGIALNRDHGLADEGRPVIRAVTPVYGPDGKTFGFMVVDADAAALLRSDSTSLDTDGAIVMLTDTDDYITQPRDGKASEFYFRGALADSVPSIVRLLHQSTVVDQTVTRRIDGEDFAIHISRLSFDAFKREQLLKIALVVPEKQFVAEANAIRNSSLWTALLLAFFASLASFAAARMVTTPLLQMVEETRAFGAGKRKISLPTFRQDEIGELSRAFTDLVEGLEKSRNSESAALSRMETLRREAVDALFVTDESGTLLEFNRSAEKLFGYAEHKVVGLNVALILPEFDARGRFPSMQCYLESCEDGSNGIVQALRTNGRVFEAELLINEIMIGGKRLFDGAVRDISERQAIERQAARHTAELERSNQDLDDFAYISSHDLKEPLRGIANHARFLQEDYAEVLGKDGNKRVQRLRELALRADTLTTELLQWSRLGRASLEMDAVDLNCIVDEVKVSLANLIEEKNAKVSVVNGLPAIRGDRSRLVSVFMNLIVNGIKYNGSAEKTIEIGVLADNAKSKGVASETIYVKDNGIGISAEFHESVFTIFKRLNHERAYGAGTGAGLSFVKKIIERHGGKIWLESEPGAGTTFYFTFPGSAA